MSKLVWPYRSQRSLSYLPIESFLRLEISFFLSPATHKSVTAPNFLLFSTTSTGAETECRKEPLKISSGFENKRLVTILMNLIFLPSSHSRPSSLIRLDQKLFLLCCMLSHLRCVIHLALQFDLVRSNSLSAVFCT
jgi:hypothetical protein